MVLERQTINQIHLTDLCENAPPPACPQFRAFQKILSHSHSFFLSKFFFFYFMLLLNSDFFFSPQAVLLIMLASVTFLIAETKYPTLKIKGEKSLFSSEFVQILVHNQLAPRQGDIWQSGNSAWQSKTAKATRRKRNKILSVPTQPTYSKVGVTLTPLILARTMPKPISGLLITHSQLQDNTHQIQPPQQKPCETVRGHLDTSHNNAFYCYASFFTILSIPVYFIYCFFVFEILGIEPRASALKCISSLSLFFLY